MSKKIDEIHSMVKHLVKGKKYDSYGSPINKQKRYVSQPQPTRAINKDISAEISNILQQLEAKEPRIKSTLDQIELDLKESNQKDHKSMEKSVMQKIDNILLYIEEKGKKGL